MENLRSLIRLQNWKVDEKRRELGELEAKRANFVTQGENLEVEMLQEQQLAIKNDMTEHYGRYAGQVIERRESLAADIAEVDKEITLVHDHLALLYQELKKFEISLERREKEALLEQQRKEQIELDEISINMHTRSGKSA